MYRPDYSISENQDLALELIRAYPLGLLISSAEQGVEANFLPFLVIQDQEETFLLTHFAKANPQWRRLQGEILVSFQGPHRYISAGLYKNKLNVPTWNYAAVRIHGTAEIISRASDVKEILKQTVDHFEAQNGTGWSYDLPASFQEKLEAALVGVKIKITRVEAKFKLSQNRSPADYQAVLNFFKKSPDRKDQDMFEWMIKTQP